MQKIMKQRQAAIEPMVRIYPKGAVVLNPAAWEAIGRSRRVSVYRDGAAVIIAPATAGDADAFLVSQNGNGGIFTSIGLIRALGIRRNCHCPAIVDGQTVRFELAGGTR